MDIDDRHLPQVAYRGSYYIHGGRSSMGLALRVSLGRPLTDADEKCIAKHVRDLEQELLAESARLDPANVEWKAEWLKRARRCFTEADIAPIYVKEIDNEYCGPMCCPHRVWLLVYTQAGPIKVGWRKSVMELNWSHSQITRSVEAVFASENVTKGDRMIHTWGYDKLTEYLRRLFEEEAR